MSEFTDVDQNPRVGYLYPYFPPEILYALGRVPVQIMPQARDIADAEPYLHKNFCALCKVILARFTDVDSPADLEGAIFLDMCDAQRRLYDVWRAYVNVPALAFLDFPRRSDLLGQEFFYSALARCVSQLEARWGQRLTVDALAASIQLYNRQRELWQDLRSAWSGGRVTTESYYALRDLCLTSDPAIANAELQAALSKAAETLPEPATQKPRLLLMSSLAAHRGLADAIQEDGRVQIVGEVSASDECRVDAPVQTEGSREELLHALAAEYRCPPTPRRRDLPQRLAYLAHLVESRRVNGVICSYFKFCDLYLAEFPIVKRFLEQRGIRVLLLEDEGETALSGQARTRLQAFFELLSG